MIVLEIQNENNRIICVSCIDKYILLQNPFYNKYKSKY